VIPLGADGAGAAGADAATGLLECRGNEPFWQLRIDRAKGLYQPLGGAPIELAGSTAALDYLPRPVLVWRGRAAPLEGDLVAWIAAEPCSDTMSDREGATAFSHRILISMPDGDVLVGCCRSGVPASAGAAPEPDLLPVADLSAKAADDWSCLLLNLLPAIETCLAANPGPMPRVTKAWPMNRGMVGVRTRDGSGGWFACVAPAVGGAPDRFEPVAPGSPRLPGEGTVLFSPAPQTPPAGVCYRHERVVRQDGGLLGLLSYDTC
jgi:uncharacterized membrane protein